MLEAHEHAIIRLEGEAIRKAKKKYAVLTNADTERIRRAVRDEYEGASTPIKLQEFEFFVIDDNPKPMPRTSEDDAEEKGSITAVGFYNPDTDKLEIAPWEDIESQLRINN